MKIYIVRHGEADCNVNRKINLDPSKNINLTEKGILQVEKLARKLKNEIIDVIFVSQFPRTKETAKIVNKFHEVLVIIDSRINETRVGFEGQNIEEYNQLIKKDRFNIRLGKGETFLEEQKIVFDFLDDLVKKDYETVLIVSHGEPIQIMRGYFKNLIPEEMIKKKIEHAKILKFIYPT